MAKKTIHMFISICVAGWNRGSVDLNPYDRGAASAEYKTVGEMDVEVEYPELDLDLLEIEGLEAAIQKERAESQSKINILLDRISKLKAIGHDSDDDGVPM